MFASLALLLAVLTGAFRPDPKIANTWTDYSYGKKERRLEQLNLPATHGVTMIFLSNKDGRLCGLDDHAQNWHFDDIGYVLFAQIAVRFFGELSLDNLAWFHNALFVCGSLLIALSVMWFSGSGILAFVAMGFLLALGREFAPHLYCSVSQHTLATVIPVVFIGLLLPMIGCLTLANRPIWTLVSIAVTSAAAGAFTLIRHPVGTACLLTSLVALWSCRSSWRSFAVHALVCIAGFLSVTRALPGLLAIERDVKLGWHEGFSWSYFQSPPKHKPYFTLLAAIGRYENSLGMTYSDGATDRYLVGKYGGTDYEKLFDQHARKEYVAYLRTYPAEYVSYLLRGCSEIFAAIPAITFQHTSIWPGSPDVTPNLQATVLQRDRAPDNLDGILNVRLAYLDITTVQWCLYLVALILVVGAAVISVRAFVTGAREGRAFLCLLVLLALLGFPRVLIPTWGQDFALAFWISAIVAPAFLMGPIKRTWLSARGASPTAKDGNAIPGAPTSREGQIA